MTSIFQHVSFFTLNESQKIRVRAYAQAPMLSEMEATYEIFKYQHDLLMLFDFWDNQINKIEQFISCPDDFKLMSAEQRGVLQDELSFAFYIINARYKLAYEEGLGHELGDHDEQIKKCINLINTLRVSTGQGDQMLHPVLPSVKDDGIQAGLDEIRFWNERRLYWVWAGRGGLLGSTISLLPDDFFYKMQALNVLDVPVPLTGGLSWALYYFRCGIRLGVLLRHTIGSWMSREEENIPWRERFAMQLHKTKFDLMNDFFWACGNLACFFWLCGNPVADYYGGAITTILLLMDVSICIWGYAEAHAQYIKDMERFKSAIQMLTSDEKSNYLQIEALRYAERQCKLDWDYKLYALYADVIYAVCLMLAFTLLYSCFLPLAAVSAGTALFWGLTGTVLCFTLNTCFTAINKGLDICKSVELSNNVAKAYAKPNQSVFDLQLLNSEWIYHQKIIEYKQACLLRLVLIDCLVPAVVFLSLVFMPLFIGLPVVMAGLILAVISKKYVDNQYQHDITCLPKHCPEAELPSPRITHGFFGMAADLLQDNPCNVLGL